MAVSPEEPLHLREMAEQENLAFPVLHDSGGAVARAYGLNFTLPEDLQAIYRSFGIDLPALNGDGAWQLPMPARYIVDPEGTIRYARVHPDYTTRPEPDEILDALGALSAP